MCEIEKILIEKSYILYLNFCYKKVLFYNTSIAIIFDYVASYYLYVYMYNSIIYHNKNGRANGFRMSVLCARVRIKETDTETIWQKNILQ